MKSIKAKLILTVFKKDMFFESCQIFGSIYNFKELLKDKLIIEIPENILNSSNGRAIIEFQLISKDKNYNPSLTFKFNAYFGINKAYCFLSTFNRTLQLYEFCFYKQARIKLEEGILAETDSFENDSRSRIILINAPNFITLDGITFDVVKFRPKIENIDENSFEVALFDVSKEYYASKLIKIKEEFSIIKNINNYKDNLEKFYSEIKNLYNQKDNDIDKYLLIVKKSGISKVEINFTQKKSVLKKEFQTEGDYYLMYIYLLWYIIGPYFTNDKDKDKDKDKLTIINILDCAERAYMDYLNDKELELYEKIMLIYSNMIFLLTFKNINDYNDSKLKYIKRKDIKPKSVFGISFYFMKNFIEKLTPQSYLFYPLLLIDSGIYKTKEQKSLYGFNMESCENLKQHLLELIPDVFFVYERKINLLEEEGGFNFKGYSVVFINKLLALNKYEKNPILYEYKNIEEERTNKHYGMRVGKTMMHESFCHNKLIFEYKVGFESPNYFYNAEMNLIRIVPVNYPQNNEYLKVNRIGEDKKGESGKFFEYFFGVYEGRLVIDLLFEAKYIGKLIDNVDYFLQKDLNIIKKYIINKYLLVQKYIKYDDYNQESLEDEIKIMEKLINEYQMKVIGEMQQKFKEENKKDNINKKADKLFKVQFIEEDKPKTEYKGYDYYSKKASEAKNMDEYYKYSHELIMNHLKVV